MWSREEIVTLYSRNDVASVGLDPQYRDLCRLHEKELAFHAEREYIERAKYQLEEAIGHQAVSADQVRAALIALRKERGQKQAVYLALIVSCYRPAWTPRQQGYFDDASRKLNMSFDFFLSFTNRHQNGPGINPINQSYKHLIQYVLGPEGVQHLDRSAHNLFALACFRLLSAPHLKGYYFPDAQYDNARTEQKLLDALSSSFVFIQLVQNVMFVRPAEGQTNYCFVEYEKTRALLANDKHSEDRLLFAVCEESRETLIDRTVVPFDYTAWHRHVVEKDPPFFEPVPNPSPRAVRSLQGMIQTRIGAKIDAAWYKILDGVPKD